MDYSVELQVKSLKGVMKWCNCRVTAIKNLNGDIIRILGVIRDIDEQKKKEFALIDEKDRMEESYRTELERALSAFDYEESVQRAKECGITIIMMGKTIRKKRFSMVCVKFML